MAAPKKCYCGNSRVCLPIEGVFNFHVENGFPYKFKMKPHSKESSQSIDVLIMSESGKPIYCYTNRPDAITLMGVCVALVNFVIKTQNDTLVSMRTRNGLYISFAIRTPLVIVVASRQHSCFDQQTLINQINAQIISTITLKSLKSVFKQAPTYDLKRFIHSKFIVT